MKVDLADDSMGEASGEENDEPTGSPEPSPQPSPVTSKGPESSPDTVASDFWGRRCDDPSQAFWGGANRVKLERRVKKADGDEAVVRAAAQIEELSAETASAPSDKAASPRLGKVPKVGHAIAGSWCWILHSPPKSKPHSPCHWNMSQDPAKGA